MRAWAFMRVSSSDTHLRVIGYTSCRYVAFYSGPLVGTEKFVVVSWRIRNSNFPTVESIIQLKRVNSSEISRNSPGGALPL